MSEYLLEAGTKLPTAKGESVKVIRFLGAGGQGEVYQVEWHGKSYALKWYYISKLTNRKAFLKNLKENIKAGSPDAHFIWPLELCELGDGFGYVMELRPSDHYEFTDFLLAKVHFESMLAAINACLHIVHAFRVLHNAGYSYQDLNDGNFFIRPSDGDVLICDNDNVAPYGTAMGIAGKCRYMAPEVVLGKKNPDNYTDRFSLSVILFMMLFLSHPLEGSAVLKCPCLSEELERKLYGEKPLFIFDKTDKSNRPDPNIHKNAIRFWPLYPESIHDMFSEALSQKALHDSKERLMEKEWEEAFVTLRDQIFKHSCSGYTFYDPSGAAKCTICGRPITKMPVLRVLRNGKTMDVVLESGKNLYEIHTLSDSNDTFKITGCIRSRKNNSMFGLENKSGKRWKVESLDGKYIKDVEPGDVQVLSSDLVIIFDGKSKACFLN